MVLAKTSLVAGATTAGAALKPHPFNAAKGLDITDVVTLAVVNNPDLEAQRAQAGVTTAQLLVAGLLPNPQISVSFLHPTQGPSPIGNGYSVGLTEDLTIDTRGATSNRGKS